MRRNLALVRSVRELSAYALDRSRSGCLHLQRNGERIGKRHDDEAAIVIAHTICVGYRSPILKRQ